MMQQAQAYMLLNYQHQGMALSMDSIIDIL